MVTALPDLRPGPLLHHDGCSSRRCAFDRPPISAEQAIRLVRLRNMLINANYIGGESGRKAAAMIRAQIGVIQWEIDRSHRGKDSATA